MALPTAVRQSDFAPRGNIAESRTSHSQNDRSEDQRADASLPIAVPQGHGPRDFKGRVVTASVWRSLMVAFCLLFMAQEAGTIWLTSTYVGSSGAKVTSSVAPFEWLLRVAPASTAYKAGLRAGDVVDARALTSVERFRLWSTVRADEPARFPVIRNGRVEEIVVTPNHEIIDWPLWLAIAAGFWSGICALILVVRKPESSEVRILVFCLLLVRLSIQMNSENWVTPSAAADAVNAVVDAFTSMGWALLATYAGLFATASDRLVTALKWLSYIAAGYTAVIALLAVAGSWYGFIDPEGGLFGGAAFVVSHLAYFLLPILCVFAVLPKVYGQDRQRFVWVSASIGVFSVIWLLFTLWEYLPAFHNDVSVTLALVLQLLAPLGLTYAMLNRRLLDIGFALNRAVVYAGVSSVVIGIFVLVEWGFGEWSSTATHAQNLAVSAGLALVLGLSVRSIHIRVDRLLDSLFFRKRYEDEQAIRTFAREAPYVTDAPTLVARGIAVLENRAGASSATIDTDDGAGSYGQIDENDEAIVSLRASHRVLDLHGMKTSLRGEFAYPMVARGRLVGVLAIGPKRSGESYAPDESAAIEGLAHSVGGALDVLMTKNETASQDILNAITRLHDSVTDIADRLRLIENRA